METSERGMREMEVVYQLNWECYDCMNDCEIVRSARFRSQQEAENFARDNELGCWWVKPMEVE